MKEEGRMLCQSPEEISDIVSYRVSAISAIHSLVNFISLTTTIIIIIFITRPK